MLVLQLATLTVGSQRRCANSYIRQDRLNIKNKNIFEKKQRYYEEKYGDKK
jgi:hypothetical protein